MSSLKKRHGPLYILMTIVGAMLFFATVGTVRDMALSGAVALDLSEIFVFGVSIALGIFLIVVGVRGIVRSMGWYPLAIIVGALLLTGTVWTITLVAAVPMSQITTFFCYLGFWVGIILIVVGVLGVSISTK
jgi:hypothetical protein